MTPEAQRIAIAEACGWKIKKRGSGFALIEPNGMTNCADCDPLTNWQSFAYRLPDYLNDLNAMHEAEKVLNYEQHCEMADMLENSFIISGPAQWKCCFATAAQRAEAFLRTIGKWKE